MNKQLWFAGEFNVLGERGSRIDLQKFQRLLEELLPHLKSLNTLEDRAETFLNDQMARGLKCYLKDAYFHADYGTPDCGGKGTLILDEDGTFSKRINFNEWVNELSTPLEHDSETLQSWVVWFEKSSKKLRKALKQAQEREASYE